MLKFYFNLLFLSLVIIILAFMNGNSARELDAIKRKMEAESAEEAKVITAACVGVGAQPPKSIQDVAYIILNLKRERDEAKAQLLKERDAYNANLRGLVKGFPEEVNPPSPNTVATVINRLRADLENTKKIQAQDKQINTGLLTSFVKGQPEDKNPPTAQNVLDCFNRLTKDNKGFKSDNARLEAVIENNRKTILDMGYKALPGIEGYFTSDTPQMNAVEAASIALYGDITATQAWLRRRKWKLAANDSWVDPIDETGKSQMNIKSALDIQLKRDIEPFKGLAGKQYLNFVIEEAKKALPTPPKDTGTVASS